MIPRRAVGATFPDGIFRLAGVKGAAAQIVLSQN